MKESKKIRRRIVSWICVIALIVSGITYYGTGDVKAQTYDQLTYTTLGYDVAYSYVSNTLDGLNVPELLDEGRTMQFAFSADNRLADTKITINGVDTAAGSGAVLLIETAIIKINPMLLPDNTYTDVVITSTTGSAEFIIRRGTPSGGGEVPTTKPGETTAVVPTAPGETTTQAPAADSLPKKVIGAMAATESGGDTIDNSAMVAWASSTDPNNVAGYDPTVTSYNVYIYQNGTQITKIKNATNGGVIGGLSAGTYSLAVSAVNSKGEGPLSDENTVTITGYTFDYKYTPVCDGPKTPSGVNIITANPDVQPSVGNEKNAIEVAWGSSADPLASSYDMTVTGYNVYIFDVETGKPYRRVYVDGIKSTYTAIKNVSSGKYAVCMSAVNAQGGESAMAAPSFTLASTVTVTGEKIDNGQGFDYPNQPLLPEGLEIITTDPYGFTIAWAATADLTGVQLNLFVNGICIKAGINNGSDSAYYENRLVAGTYDIEVKAQYIDNKVESFPIAKRGVTINADPGLTTQTPESLADPAYSGYKEPETTTEVPTTTDKTDEETTTKEPTSENPTTKPVTPTENPTTKKPVTPTQKPTVKPIETVKRPAAKVKVGKVKIKSASKKKDAGKAKISLKKVRGAKGYQVRISTSRKIKKYKTKNTKKLNFTVNGLKPNKKYYVKARAYKVVKGRKQWGGWCKPKQIRFSKK